MVILKNDKKADIRKNLIVTGRKLVVDKGMDNLTARKLAEASKSSVGTIYNQFSNMDNFVIEQNIVTIKELYQVLTRIVPGNNFHKNLNNYIDTYVGWIMNNKNLWMLLYNFHLHNDFKILPSRYQRHFLILLKIWDDGFAKAFGTLSSKERKIARQVLLLSLFSTSSFLMVQSTGRISKKNICKILLNTYLAGLEVLKRIK